MSCVFVCVWCGGVAAYACFFWLLENVPIATAISYEYVVPVIGIFLGWLLGGEMLTWKMLLDCTMTVGSVFFIMWHRE